MSLLSRMFGRRGPQKPIDEMSLAEVVAFMRSNEKGMASNEAIAVARRLTDIGYFEHGITDVERKLALATVPALDEDIEAALGADSEAFQAYCEAAAYHRGNAVHHGFGSLQWKMDEEAIEAAQVIPFIARADHAALLPAFLEMMEPDVIHSIRGALLNEMTRSRAHDAERPVEVLSRLASSDDGSLTLLLDGRQLGALRRASMEPEAAGEVLAELGVGPEKT